MTSMKLSCTASLLHNNLAASPGGWLAGLHNSVNSGGGKIFLHNNGTAKDGPEITSGTSIRYVHLAHGTVLCVSSMNGTQIYSEDASTLLHFANVTDPAKTEHHRGACVVAPMQHIVLGTSKGGLALVGANGGCYIPLPESAPASPAGEVADLCYSAATNTVVTAHDDGVLHVWAVTPTGPYTDTGIIPSAGQAPLRIEALQSHLMVAYVSGHIRLFDAMNHSLKVELTAHARCLTAVDVRVDLGQVASVGEDTVLNVWHVDDSGQVSLQHTCQVTPKLLTGVMLLTNGAAVSAYDSDELIHMAF